MNTFILCIAMLQDYLNGQLPAANMATGSQQLWLTKISWVSNFTLNALVKEGHNYSKTFWNSGYDYSCY
jgi:hypothetical protein